MPRDVHDEPRSRCQDRRQSGSPRHRTDERCLAKFFDGEPNVEACAVLLIDDAGSVFHPGHEDLPPMRRGHAVWRQRVPASPGPRPPWPERAPRARRPERHGRYAIVPDESRTPFLMLRTRSKTRESRHGDSWSVTVYRSRGPPYHHVAFYAHREDESLRHF